MDKLTVLAIGAHADDLEILCSGTLLRYVDAGAAVVMSHMTDGEQGGYDDAPKVSRTRLAEAAAAAEYVGAEYHPLALPEATLSPSDFAQIRLVTELVKRVRPDVVITHHPNDYHDDHVITSQIVVDATFKASIPLYEADGRHLALAPPVFFMETISGLRFEPTDFVDITPVFERKLATFGKHESQVAYLREHYDQDFTEQIDAIARVRGFQCGVRYAEGFTQLQRWPRMQTRRLLP